MLLPKAAALAASMLEDKLVQSGQVGRVETKVFTYDGNPIGKETYDIGGIVAIRVGDSIDPADIKKIVGVLAGQEMEILAGQWSITQVVDGVISLVAHDIGFVIIATGDNALGISPGTYASQNENYYVSRIETETIHPIDQKYLPGVCLPVVELSTTLSTGAILTDEESAKLTEAYAAACPVVIKCDITLGALRILYCSIIFSRGEMYGDVTAPAFYASFGSTTLALMYMSNFGWVFQAD